MNIWNRIDESQRIQEWIDWCEIQIEIVNPGWGEHIPRGQYSSVRKVIIINGKQSRKEIIKSIIHEICHWINGDQFDDVDIIEREERCQRVERQWKVKPSEVIWR